MEAKIPWGQEEIKTIEEVADIVVGIFPEEELRKYERELGGRTLTLKDQFIDFFTRERARPRRVISRYFLEMSTLQIIVEKRFGPNNMDFSAFNLFFV